MTNQEKLKNLDNVTFKLLDKLEELPEDKLSFCDENKIYERNPYGLFYLITLFINNHQIFN